MKFDSIIEKTFLNLLPIQIVMILISSINSIIDGAIASNFVSVTALAVIALFFPVIKLLETINAIFLGGTQILCGRYIGKNQIQLTTRVFSTDIFFIIAVGLVVSTSCVLFSRPIAALFISDQKIIEELSDYIFGYSFGIIPMMLIPQLIAFLQMERQERRTYVGMATMIALNVLLNLLFVVQLDMGMLGLGLATSVSNLVFLLIIASYYFFHDPTIRFDIKEIHPEELINIVVTGFPGAVSNLGQTGRAALLNMIMLTFIGSEGVSAFAAIGAFGYVYYAVTGGVATAVRILASIYYGEEDRIGLYKIMKTALINGTILVCIVAAVCMMLAPIFTKIFYGPEAGEVYKMTLTGFILFPISMPFSCLFSSFSMYYQCLGRMKIANLLMITDGLIGVILFSYILAPLLGMNGIWIAQIANGVLVLMIILIYTRVRLGRMPASIQDMLVLDEGFGVAEEDRIDIQIEDMGDVISLSQNIISFSRNHNMDHKRSMFAGLCAEEMAGNIVEHGFDGKKTYHIDVHVVYKDDSLLLRIKDNCRTFNPKEVQNLFDPDDVTHNIGLRIVSKTAKSMSYHNCLGLNVLTINI